jgi:hypothetical protein
MLKFFPQLRTFLSCREMRSDQKGKWDPPRPSPGRREDSSEGGEFREGIPDRVGASKGDNLFVNHLKSIAKVYRCMLLAPASSETSISTE